MIRVLIIVILAMVVGGGATLLWRYYGGFEGEEATAVAFIDAYGVYKDVALRVETLVHLPGTEGNAYRQELLTLLSSMLTEDLSPERRDALARIAFANLDAIKKEIDAAQASQAELYRELQDFDNAARVFVSIDLQRRAGEIVAIARKRAELSARITASLSETNDHAYAIITRILDEKGVLSVAHIQAINETTDAAEERFHTLEELYLDLQAQQQLLDERFAEFVQAAL